jgi:hypothetical protein
MATLSPSRSVDATASASDMNCAIGYGRGFSGRVIYEGLSAGSNDPMLSQNPIFHVQADLGDIQHFGRTPYGERRVIEILGGRVEGERLGGRILPGGADWQIVRPDGVTDISARYAIEAEGGGRILVASDGLRHGPPEVLASLARGEDVDPGLYYFRTVMRFETADPALDWLNRILALAVGRRRRNAVEIDVYEVL